jgi:hypothetical protein
VSVPPATGRRKSRLVRDDPPPDDRVVVVRATGPDRDQTVADMVRDARYSGDTYAIERPDGSRDVLFGVSVFAVQPGRTVADVLERFATSSHYLAVTIGTLRAAGFAVIPTGANTDHFDVQLVAGIPADRPAPAVTDADLAAKAKALVELAGPAQPNPAYTL